MAKRVVVIGAGPAGLSASIFLAQHGFEVAIADREVKRRLAVGESLSPAAGTLLQDLGVWDEFRSAPHLECYGNVSIWGASQPKYVDFINSQYGHGWHIDRKDFEEMLRARALALGVELYTSDASLNIDRCATGWSVTVPGTTIYADFLVDASGRAHAIARKQGIARVRTWEQIALVSFISVQHELENTASLVESTENGWWYSAAIPGKRIVICFFTHTDARCEDGISSVEQLKALMQPAVHTLKRIEACGACVLNGAPAYVDASAACLAELYGSEWIAVGDAACSYDPLSAHGLTKAMTSGRDAANAIVKHFAGDAGGLEEYASTMRDVFNYTNNQCRLLYQSERRWPTSPFWSTAHVATTF